MRKACEKHSRQSQKGGGREEEGIPGKTAVVEVYDQAHQPGSQKVAQKSQQPDGNDALFPKAGFVFQAQDLGCDQQHQAVESEVERQQGAKEWGCWGPEEASRAPETTEEKRYCKAALLFSSQTPSFTSERCRCGQMVSHKQPRSPVGPTTRMAQPGSLGEALPAAGHLMASPGPLCWS